MELSWIMFNTSLRSLLSSHISYFVLLLMVLSSQLLLFFHNLKQFCVYIFIDPRIKSLRTGLATTWVELYSWRSSKFITCGVGARLVREPNLMQINIETLSVHSWSICVILFCYGFQGSLCWADVSYQLLKLIVSTYLLVLLILCCLL